MPFIVEAEQIYNSRKIWDYAPHNAFTSLIEYNNSLYLTFREGRTHADRKGGDNGTIRILKSRDGKKWRSVGSVQMKGFDLRDPQLLTSPDGKLCLLFVAATYKDGRPNSYHTYMSKVKNGKFDSLVRLKTPLPADWLWRVHWHKGVAYGFNYINTFDLLASRDGVNYEIIRNYKMLGRATEADFIPKGDSVTVVVRNDDYYGMIGQGTLSDGNIKWQRINKKILAPCLFQVDSKTTFLMATEYNSLRELRIYKIKGTDLQLLGTLPASGDCGYMGAAIFKKHLYVSYYSSVKPNKTAICMAKIPLDRITSL